MPRLDPIAPDMETWHVVLLALIQALTEFLPVSSSGHLALVGFFLGWPYQGLTFDLALHLGTLVAVIVYFWRDLLLIARETLKLRRWSQATPVQLPPDSSESMRPGRSALPRPPRAQRQKWRWKPWMRAVCRST